MEMRIYKNLPHPKKQAEEFNQYLRDNNDVVKETDLWIVIENSYIKDQRVAFCKLPVRDAKEYFMYAMKTDSPDTIYFNLLREFAIIFMAFNGKHIYINSDQDKSVPDRFHLHMKIKQNENRLISLQ